MPRSKFIDERTGKSHIFDWNKDRPPSRQELDDLIAGENGVPAPTFQSPPKVEAPSAPMTVPNQGKSFMSRMMERDQNSIGSRLATSWETLYGGERSVLPAVPGVTRPLLPDIPGDPNASILSPNWVGKQVYDAARSSSSLLGAATDFVGGRAIGAAGNRLAATAPGKWATEKAASIFGRAKSVAPPSAIDDLARVPGPEAQMGVQAPQLPQQIQLSTHEIPKPPEIANIPAVEPPVAAPVSNTAGTPRFGQKKSSAAIRKAQLEADADVAFDRVTDRGPGSFSTAADFEKALKEETKKVTQERIARGPDSKTNYLEGGSGKKTGQKTGPEIFHPDRETIYRGGNLQGKEGTSFWTTDPEEAIGYASLADRPEDRIFHIGENVRGQYPSGNITTGGNIPEKWANIQRAVPNEKLEDIIVRGSHPVPYQGDPNYRTAAEGILRKVRGEPDVPSPHLPGRSPEGFKLDRAKQETMFDVASPDAQKEFGAFRKALNTPRELWSAADFSAPRQAIATVGRKEFWKNTPELVKSFFSKENFNKTQQMIAEHPKFKQAKDSGVAFSDVDKLGPREEAFARSYAESIPIVKDVIAASNRSFTGFLNKVRMDAYDKWGENIIKGQGKGLSEKQTKDLGKIVNTLTGRGDLGRLEHVGDIINDVAYSPRLFKSRVDILNPVYYKRLDPAVRKEMLKSTLSSAALISSVIGMAKAGGADVELDPRSSDFAKIKVGNTRVDLWGGHQQFVRTAAQLMPFVGGVKSSTTGKVSKYEGKFGERTRLDVAEDFFEGKSAPVVSMLIDLMRGKDFTGKPITLKDEAIKAISPMIAKDMYDLYKDDPSLTPLIFAGMFGAGLQTYERKSGSLTKSEKRRKRRAAARNR